MDPTKLIPALDTIPAPAVFFQLLDIITFTLHVLLMNVILGGSLILLFSRFTKNDFSPESSLSGALSGKIPTSFALAINLGVAPLLFIQVIYGHLIYSSSVFMAVYWILIIPLLIIAYYGAYIHAAKYNSAALSKISLLLTTLILLYIAFIFVNNMTLMLQPEKWGGYLNNKSGLMLNTGDPMIYPRYLHVITGAIAIAGLFAALVWNYRKKNNANGADEKIKSGLKIFAYATMVQIIIGVWFLLSLPTGFASAFLGGKIFPTLIISLGFISGIAAIVTALKNKLTPTIVLAILTIVLMVINRENLRWLYLHKFFSFKQLQLAPQYGVMTLFLIIFVIGLAIVAYMIKISYQNSERRAA